jgi:translocation and assembly module TamB
MSRTAKSSKDGPISFGKATMGPEATLSPSVVTHSSGNHSLSRRLAQLICLLLGAIGALPILVGLVVRTERVRLWAEQQTSRVLNEQLGVRATFQASVTLWPIGISIEDLRVPANDGGAPVLTVKRTVVSPRFFSLLSGKLDAGDVLIEAPKARLDFEQGKLKNLTYRLPHTNGESRFELKESPFTAVSITDASADVVVDGRAIQTDSFDLDVIAQPKLAFEVFLRSSETRFSVKTTRTFSSDTPSYEAYDEDVLCQLDLRARVTPSGALVRRLSLLGLSDTDPKLGTRPRCGKVDNEADPSLVALRLSAFSLDWSRSKPNVDGQVFFRAPVGMLNRYVKFLPVKGWLGLRGHVRYDGQHQMPDVQVKLHGEDLALDKYRLFKELDVEARIVRDHVVVDELEELFADGRTRITDVDIAPFEPGVPFTARRVEVKNMKFPGLMRDLGVTDKTIVAWDFGDTVVSDLKGRLALPEFEGHIVANTKDFEVTDIAFNDPKRKHMIGVSRAHIDGRIAVKPNALEFRDNVVTFGASRIQTNLVSIGFDNTLALDVADTSSVDLRDISPVATIPLAGKAKMGAHMKGLASDPILNGSLSVKDLVFARFPIGDILSSKVKFWPLKVDITETLAVKGQSQFVVDSARLDFDTAATVVVDAHAKSDNLSIRDFLAMWQFENDPRYAEVTGRGTVDGKIRYVLGGPADSCGGGQLRVDGNMHLSTADLFGEHYDSVDGAIGFNWLDQEAGFLGFSLDVPHLVLRKGPGAIIGAFQVRPGAELTGHAIATKVPLAQFQSTTPWGMWLDTEVSAVAEIGGTLDSMTGIVRANLTPIRIGSATLPASEITVGIESVPRKLNTIGITKCGRPISGPFDLAEYNADKSQGAYRIDGQLLGGQIRVDNLRLTRQNQKHLEGNVAFHRLALGSLVDALPVGLRPERVTNGTFSANLHLQDLPLAAPRKSQAELTLRELALTQGELELRAVPSAGAVRVRNGRVEVPGLTVETTFGKTASATWDIAGNLEHLDATPVLHSTLRLRPVNLKPLARVVPGLRRLSGLLSAQLSIDGKWSQPRMQGFLSVDKGELEFKNFEYPVNDVALRLSLSENELRIEEGRAKIGSGTLTLKGGAPLVGLELGNLRLMLQARGLVIPEHLGIRGLADADLEVAVEPSNSSVRPRVSGVVWFDGLEYTRPVAMTADVAQLAQRGRRSHVESYDPNEDFVDLDLLLYSKSPLRIRNGLIEAEMELDKEGLQLVGTNQRFGLRGNVRAVPGGRVSLRQSVFEIREGHVRFDDATRIAPRVDVKATTEYRRYSNQSTAQANTSSSAPSSSGTSVAGATGGQWRITMHAYGDADQLRIDLTSDPALSQDDILLLLMLGVTRAELDQAQSTSVGSSVALETLGTLSGADRAVTDTIPLIDDFRFGSAYSARTGRTEPTVTIGKRLADRIRASVTSGLAETREVRSNVEWRLGPQLSVEGSYDNVNDISSSQLGNLGADVRWRIEFR